jgi:hypothetical protein
MVLELFFLHPSLRRTRVEKVNAELVTLTYGTIVAQLCQDYDHDYVEVNAQLERMGYSIGMRLIEDFLARSGTGRCGSFRDTAEVISKVKNSALAVPAFKAKRRLGRFQDVLEYHTDDYKLDQRQQAVLVNLRREPFS